MSNQSKSERTEKNGTKMALRYAKSDERYWQSRVELWNATDKFLSVRISYQGKRKVFKLHTAIKKVAAKKAKDIYLDLVANGWENESDVKVITDTTVGDVIRVYLELTEAAEKTAANYTRVFRSVVSDIKKISGDKKRFDYVNGGNEKWKAKVDNVLLSDITQAEVQKWKVTYVKARNDDPVKASSARESANSYIRYCRSIFKPDILPHMMKELTLPDDLPFSAVKLYPRQKTKYASTFDITEVMQKAKDELPGIEQDQQWLIFVLAVSAGMRRNEVDKLTWRQINFNKNQIDLSATKYFKPKSENSGTDVDIDPDLSTLLRGYRAKYKDAGEFVIQSDIKPVLKAKVSQYRANRHHQALVTWLRKQGVDARKPIHTLRKEAGSEVCRQYGLHAASTFLRHADIQVTSDHYVENKGTIRSGFGTFLAGNIDDIEQGRKAE